MSIMNETVRELGEESGGEPLWLWRVSLMSCVEVAAYSREEAIYNAVSGVSKASKELLRPFYVAQLEILEQGKLEEKKESSASDAGSFPDDGTMHGGGFEPSSDLKAKWVRELTEKITAEVNERLSQEGFTPVPIPIK